MDKEMQETVTHKEIHDRLITVEGKVDAIATDTADVVAAFQAAKGAFVVLEFLARIAKPVILIAIFLGAMFAAAKKWGA
jgi:hypothetical protein